VLTDPEPARALGCSSLGRAGQTIGQTFTTAGAAWQPDLWVNTGERAEVQVELYHAGRRSRSSPNHPLPQHPSGFVDVLPGDQACKRETCPYYIISPAQRYRGEGRAETFTRRAGFSGRPAAGRFASPPYDYTWRPCSPTCASACPPLAGAPLPILFRPAGCGFQRAGGRSTALSDGPRRRVGLPRPPGVLWSTLACAEAYRLLITAALLLAGAVEHNLQSSPHIDGKFP
jgi:hypothetical protein